LHLQLNNIDILFRWVFRGLAKLKVLNLSANSLVEVPQQSIGGLPRLESLDLSANPLHDFVFDDHFFQAKQAACVIDLSWNKISMIPGSLFRHNPMLEVINLRGNRISQMEPAAFAFLAHLRSLDVQNNRFLCDCDIVPLQQWIIENTSHSSKLPDLTRGRHCATRVTTCIVTSGRFVPRRYYVNCSNLRMPDLPRGRLPTVGVLDMTGNSVTTVGVESFRSSCGAFKVTRTLDLSNNLISSIHNDSFGCFVALERLHLQLNNIDILFRWVFRGLAKLKVLNLSANSLVQVPQQSIGGLPRLESLDLSANPLHDFCANLSTTVRGIRIRYTTIKTVGDYTFSNVAGLRRIDLSHNKLASVHSAAFSDVPSLREIDLSNNNLQRRGLNAGMFSGLKVKFLFLSKCNIRQISSSAFNGSTHMKVIDLSWNKISMIPGSLFRHNPMLEVINLRGNRISQMEPAAFAFLAHLPTRTLDLSNNLISSIHNDSFGCFVALERLHLQLNNIDILFRWVFRGLAKLKVLNLSANSLVEVPQQSIGDLSHNKLASVHSAAFSDVPSLREIDLSNNNLQRISMIPGSLFRHNPMLEVINLRGNRISQMEPAAFAFLAHLRSLDVQNNRFLCDCDIVPLQQWIIENTYTTARHRRRILFENATCFQQSSHAYLEMLRWDAGKQCWMKSTVVTGIAFASVLLVVCCVAFAYSSRFQALFWYEMVKAKISYRRKVPADAFGGNEYNAYISCVPDSNDEAWVVRHLLSAIENPPYELEPMKLCFPSRDFRPGRPKTASAASGIRSAERTLVILSAGYARCSWTRLELSMVSEMWRSGERSAESLVVVYLKRRGEDWVDVERLPVLGVRKNRWLIWPLEVADRPAFWMKLRRSL
uniref:TIR domain-containing protein n=1 Tax=Ciona savignyi TaxID=51511 RepID=H2Y4T2_CIOSA